MLHYWMDGRNWWRHLLLVPAPVTKLSDRFADYTLRIQCRKCGHERRTEPHFLARIMGWETPLTKVAARLRCS
jgi:hypothetical protein